MNLRRTAASFTLALMAAACTVGPTPPNKGIPQIQNPSAYISGNAGEELSPAELTRLELCALKGDGESARRLFLYHLDWTQNAEMAQFWMDIALENKDPIMIAYEIQTLSQQADARSLARMEFWKAQTDKRDQPTSISSCKTN